jgi:hypothetical protein
MVLLLQGISEDQLATSQGAQFKKFEVELELEDLNSQKRGATRFLKEHYGKCAALCIMEQKRLDVGIAGGEAQDTGPLFGYLLIPRLACI